MNCFIPVCFPHSLIPSILDSRIPVPPPGRNQDAVGAETVWKIHETVRR